MKTAFHLLAVLSAFGIMAATSARAFIFTNFPGTYGVSNGVDVVLLSSSNASWVGGDYQDAAPSATLYCRFSMEFNTRDLFAGLEFYNNGNEVFGVAENAYSADWSYFYYPGGAGIGDLNPATPLTTSQWHTFVVKLVFNQGAPGNDSETVWMDPVWANPESAQSSAIVTTPAPFDAAFNAVYLRCGNTPASATYSNIVFATTGADVGFGGMAGPTNTVSSTNTTVISTTNAPEATYTESSTDTVQVLTFHNDNMRSGVNTNETALTLADVNTNFFGKLFTDAVDGYVYAQPLVATGVTIPGKGVHNVVYVVTEHDSVYAFDADGNSGSNAAPLWQTTFLVNGEMTVPASSVGTSDVTPEVGITSTPVIDPTTGTLYIEAKTETSAGAYVHRLHALDMATGLERTNFNSPAVIAATNYPGVGGGGSDTDGAGHVLWNPLLEHNRPALALLNGNIYIAYASHGDNTPFHGWLFAYNATNVAQQTGVFNTTPNGTAGGFWQSGGGPSIDAAGNIYLMTGNGDFNATGTSPTNNYSMSFVKFSTTNGITLTDFFTMTNYLVLSGGDEDFGSGAPLVLPDAAGSPAHPHLLVGAGKEGRIYLADRDHLGGYNPGGDQVVQEFYGLAGGGQNGSFDTPVYFNNLLYYWATGDSLKAFSLTNGFINPNPTMGSSTTGHYGPTPCLTANGTNNAIVWALQVDAFGSGGPAVLRAYNATNITQELYNSSQMGSRDVGPAAVKFATPAVVNGRVYVGGQYALTVYGLGIWVPAPTIAPAGGSFTNSITVTLSDSDSNASIYYTLDGSTPTANSTLYSAPLVLTQSSQLEVVAVEGSTASAAVAASFIDTLSGPPPPWSTSDIGTVGAAGNAYYSNGKFTIQGSGDDIWNGADDFRYVYFQVTNNCDISARVTSQAATDPWAKAGVMIRETLNSAATEASMTVTPGNGFGMYYRAGTGGSTAYAPGTALNPPPNNWVRLTRTNTVFTAYESANGTNWTVVGGTTLTMTGSGYYVGLAVCSHDEGTLCSVNFDNVIVNGNAANNPPPAVVMTAPANNATYTAAASVGVGANADSADGTIAKVDFYANNSWVGTVSNAPYTLTVTGLGAGNYALSAVATDNFGLTNGSAAVNITVNPGSGAPYGATGRGVVPAFFNLPTTMPAQLPGTVPPLLSLTGVFSDTPSETPMSGMILYQPNTPLWSDAAVKTRWMGVPYNGGAITPAQQIAFAPTGTWTFPAGTVFVKDFQLITNQVSGGKRRLETRLLVRDVNGAVYGVTYKWRPDNSEADLLTNSLDEAIPITGGGSNWIQTWHYPSPSECLQCHTPVAGYVLGLSVRQLNGVLTYPATGVTDNQIRTLNRLGLFNPAPDEAAIGSYEKLSALTNLTASFQERARSYLDANCAFCHQPGGSGPTFDGRYETPLPGQNITNVPAVKGNLGISDGAMIVRPQDIWRSVLYQRMDVTDNAIKMPPLARNLIDTNAVTVVGGWINSLPGTPALAPPTVTPDGGTFSNSVLVALASTNVGASIYYTFDGSLPTTSSFLYSSPFLLATNALLTVDAIENGYNTSISSNAAFAVAYSSPPPPLLLRMPFTNGAAIDGGNNVTASDTSSGGVAVTMNLLTNGVVAGNLHGAAGTGVAGAMALDLTAATVPSQGVYQAGNNGGVGPIISLTNSATLAGLGGGGVITNFTATLWIRQSVAYGAAGGHAPRLWNLAAGSAGLDADSPAANSMGLAVNSSTQFYFNSGNPSWLLTGTTPAAMVAGQWYFVAVTYDGTAFRMYLGTDGTNAVLIGTTTVSGWSLNLGASGGVASLTIGNRGNDFGRSFNGWLEDFRIYGSAGNSNFVESIRQSTASSAIPMGSSPSSLQLRMPFTNSVTADGGSGVTVSDTNSGGVAVTMNLLTNGVVAGNLHGAAGTGVAGAMALDLTAATVPSQGVYQAGNNGGVGPIISLTNSAALAGLGAGGVFTNFTATLWIKQNIAYGAAGGHAPRLWNLAAGSAGLDADSPTANSMGLAVNSSTQFYFNSGNPNWLLTGTTPAAMVAGQWYFVAVTYDGTAFKMYLGTDSSSVGLIGTTAVSGWSLNLGASGGVASLTIGNRGNDFGRSFNGWLEDFRIYSIAGNSNFVDTVRQSAGASSPQPQPQLVRRSPPLLLNAVPKSGGQFTLQFSGMDGENYRVEMATNLTDGFWTPVYTNIQTGGVFIYTDINATGAARFYRVRN